MVRGSPRMCMATQPAPAALATGAKVADTSLSEGGAGGQGGLGHLGLAGVDRHPDVGGQGLDHGQDPAQLLAGVDRLRPRTGALPADVDDVGPLGDHPQAVGDGRAGVEPPTTVGK